MNWHDYGARFYDPQLGRFHTVDPLAEDYDSWTPYHYVHNNPILLIDPTGMGATRFEDEEGKTVANIDDGSNAVFRQTGEGNSKHYEFTGFDESQGGVNVVSLSTAIQEQQNLNNENPSIAQNADGNGETHCNQSTQNTLKTVASVTKDESLKVTGRANTMLDKMASGEVKSLVPASLETARANAKQGGLSIVGFRPVKGTGHVATFSTGTNIKKGEIQNIGPKKYSGFVSLNSAISKKKTKNILYSNQYN